MEGLKPCPWAKNDFPEEHIPRMESASDIMGMPLYFIDCNFGASCYWETTEKKAIEAWNNR